MLHLTRVATVSIHRESYFQMMISKLLLIFSIPGYEVLHAPAACLLRLPGIVDDYEGVGIQLGGRQGPANRRGEGGLVPVGGEVLQVAQRVAVGELAGRRLLDADQGGRPQAELGCVIR